MSRRTEQLSSTLQRAIQQVLARGLADPRYGGLVTVTGLKITEDLKNADVLISVLPEEKQELTMHAIRHAAAHIRREAAELVAMRTLPTLNFRLDLSLKKQAEVLRAISKAAEVTPPAPDQPDDVVPGGNNPNAEPSEGGRQENPA